MKNHNGRSAGTETVPATEDSAATNKDPGRKKRRKVNHACVYCRRSHMTCDLERPCTRCIKRNIGHMCHDEPRDSPSKKSNGRGGSEGASDDVKTESTNGMFEPAADRQNGPTFNPITTSTASAAPAQIVQPVPVSASQIQALDAGHQSFLGYGDWGVSNHFQDVNNPYTSYMFNAVPELNDEYNLIHNFLSHSLIDDGNFYGGINSLSAEMTPIVQTVSNTPAPPAGFVSSNNSTNGNNPSSNTLAPPASQILKAGTELSISRPASTKPSQKSAEAYYLAAADPLGNDSPEARMESIMKAKIAAGLLKPFNYVNGYRRLNQFMEKNMANSSRQRILRQLDKFRPKFRERMQALTDVELVYVEAWFEKGMMEYDRVFASMAIPACCWRRTGEIFRGNKEMAELIRVPFEQLGNGKLAIHEIFAEESLVSYWEKFGPLAFDSNQKAMLTRCKLKIPNSTSSDDMIDCCFSFTIRRDSHNIPSIIVGNFLPQDPNKLKN